MLLGVWGCGTSVEELEFELLRTLPHDPAAYTQGLVFHGGSLYESTGRYGESEVREVEVESGRVLRRQALSDDHFAEGIAVVGAELIQLTWKAGIAFVYDLATLTVQRTFEYEGEGWGLCYDGTSLYMTNGSGMLARRDPSTFEVIEEIRVSREGFSVRNLNELECVDEYIYANVFMSDEILRIDKSTGAVTGEMDGFSLSVAATRPADDGAVLNGIAWDPGTRRFLVTGKLWAQMFEIELRGG